MRAFPAVIRAACSSLLLKQLQHLPARRGR
jgi:hypothetical protein